MGAVSIPLTQQVAFTQPRVHLATLRAALVDLAQGGTKGTLAEQAVRANVPTANYAALLKQPVWDFPEVCLVAAALPATITVAAA